MSNYTDEQLLRDPDIRPTDEVIAGGLKDAYNAFMEFADGLETHGISLMEWRYYDDGKAWLTKGEYKWTTSRGTAKVKPIFWLSIWEGFFRVAFFFSSELKDELLNLPISENARALIENAKAMGKTMRFFPAILDIKSGSQLSDVYELACFKKIKG